MVAARRLTQDDSFDTKERTRLSVVPDILRQPSVDQIAEYEAITPVINSLIEYQLANLNTIRLKTPQPEPEVSRRGYIYMSRVPEDGQTIRYRNIRPLNVKHVQDLAISILETGQKSECLADTVITDQGPLIRVLAGQHRYMAVYAINQARALINQQLSIDEQLPYLPLEIKAEPDEKTLGEILVIQLNENLQHKMQAAEKAQSIYAMWLEYQYFASQQDAKPTQAGFIKFTNMGLGEAEVANAIAFGLLDGRVQQMVIGGAIKYSDSLVLGRLKAVHENGDLGEAQFRVAVHAIISNLKPKALDDYISHIIRARNQVSLGDIDSLDNGFALLMQPENEYDEFAITLKRVAGKQAQEAHGYFQRVIRLITVLEDNERIYLTEAVKKLIVDLLLMGEEFVSALQQLNPDIAQQIAEELRSLRE